tara:strand:+ start:1227 stop:1394 length:168 start_codon:yes stop_codon:yes gene_type:complete
MASIVFTNFDGESLEIDLSKTNNLDALKQGIKHLDKAVYKNKNKPKTNNETIKGT